MPRIPESELLDPQIRGRLQRSEGDELKGGVGEREQGENKPEAFEARDTAKPVAQCDPHGTGAHHQSVAGEHPEQRKKNLSNGVLE